MLKFQSISDKTLPISPALLCGIPRRQEELLFFDIETTGFSADISSLYLIGAAYYEEQAWHLLQWFADDYCSEEAILLEFFDFLSRFPVLIHYNGSGFDLPYLQKKCAQYRLSRDFSGLLNLDLYKRLLPYKKPLSLPSLRLKAVEQALGLMRRDECDGGELIKVYSQYLQNKFLRRMEQQPLLEQLLLHNREDVENLIPLAAAISAPAFFEQPPQLQNAGQEGDSFFMDLLPPAPLSLPIAWENGWLSLHAADNAARLSIKLLNKELRYFYPNYKDYYYLPLEDTAIHKSVASYVDKEHKEKAKASNCYTKKDGTFLPQQKEILIPCFKQEYKDKLFYGELTDAFRNDRDAITRYAAHLLELIRSA